MKGDNVLSVGFPISHKENEFRRPILPKDIPHLDHPEDLFFEKGYGEVFGLEGREFTDMGSRVVSREEVLASDIICDPKIGDADFLPYLDRGQILFGWVHAAQHRDLTDTLISRSLTAYAWENMYENGRHVFWRNNELAGEAAVIHGFQCYGEMPYNTKVAVIGRGNTARGALRVLDMMGADVVQYDRRTEDLLRRELPSFDVVVNCVLWDIRRKDHIISREDLRRMKRGAMIIDVSCDRNGGIETTVPTTFEDPVYMEEGIFHYAVDHTPSLFYRTFSRDTSGTIYPFINDLMEGKKVDVLEEAKIIEDGTILDDEISEYQNR